MLSAIQWHNKVTCISHRPCLPTEIHTTIHLTAKTAHRIHNSPRHRHIVIVELGHSLALKS